MAESKSIDGASTAAPPGATLTVYDAAQAATNAYYKNALSDF